MKQIKILFTIFISSLFVSSAYASTIENIQAVDNKTIKIAASSDVTFSDTKVYWDVKVLRDIDVLSATKDATNSKKVTLNLSSELYKNSAYSLIWVMWAEWNIDFEIGETFTWEKINPNFYNEEKIIEKIVIINSKTIDVYYSYQIIEGLFEFKLLSELGVESVSSKGNNVLDVNLSTALEKSSSYILMVASLENIDGKELSFNESLYDFSTNSTLTAKSLTPSEVNIDKVVKTTTTDTNANMEEVSLNAAETPDAGAETWFVMLLTFIFSTMYFVRNKFKKV